MRMMLRAQIPVQAGNRAIQDGTIAKVLEETLDHLKPEAAYFLSENGQRAVYAFFDLEDPSKIPPTVEPLFIHLDANVELIPVMNVDELKQGLKEFSKGM